MKYRILLLIGLVAFLIAPSALSACTTANAEENESVLNVGLNNVFEISIESNPTTGYSWQVEYDESYLEYTWHVYESSSKAIGAGGTEYMSFKALKSGETRINLIYKRPWEATALKNQSYTVLIGDGSTPTPVAISEGYSADIARRFLINSSTFKFDGISDSVNLVNTVTMRTPYCWEFTFNYLTGHPGHGNREGEVLLMVIANHQARITVQGGLIISAICEQWNMIKQAPLPS